MTDNTGEYHPQGNVATVWFNSLMDAMIEAIIVVDEHGVIERFNKAAETMFGYTCDEAMGHNIRLLMPDPDRDAHDTYMDNYMRTGERKIIGIGREVLALRRNGEVFTADLAIGEVRWEGARRFVGLMRDLTERKRVEEQAIRRREEMIQVGRVTTMGEMAASMAHELNQPLTAIANYSSACKRLVSVDKPDIDNVREALDKINHQAHRASEVIRRLRDFVKYDATTRESTTFAALVEEVIPLALVDANAHNVRLAVELDPNLPEIVVDGLQIQQVVLNLLRNGIDAMRDADPADRQLLLKATCRDDRLDIEVVDHGTGIAEDAVGRVFDAFFTTKTEGMGMGLAICRTIVQSHGGTLSCANNPGGGATFRMSLPTGLE